MGVTPKPPPSLLFVKEWFMPLKYPLSGNHLAALLDREP